MTGRSAAEEPASSADRRRRTGLKSATGKVRAARSQARRLTFSAPSLIFNVGIHDLQHRVMTRHTGSDKNVSFSEGRPFCSRFFFFFFHLHGQYPSEFINIDIPV